MKRTEREAVHSHPPSAKFKDGWICFSTLPDAWQSAKYNKIIHIFSMALPGSAWKKNHNVTWHHYTSWLLAQMLW